MKNKSADSIWRDDQMEREFIDQLIRDATTLSQGDFRALMLEAFGKVKLRARQRGYQEAERRHGG